jgi:hypothetical protein
MLLGIQKRGVQPLHGIATGGVPPIEKDRIDRFHLPNENQIGGPDLIARGKNLALAGERGRYSAQKQSE